MKTITLTKGFVALVDDEDYERVNKHSWYAIPGRETRYAVRTIRHKGGRKSVLRLHRFILMAHEGVMVDHRNRNGLDCRRSNLREASLSQNGANAKLNVRNTSGFKGVVWKPPRRKWEARVHIAGKAKHLGYFPSPEEAARIYDASARSLYGEFARVNFPLPGEQGCREDA